MARLSLREYPSLSSLSDRSRLSCLQTALSGACKIAVENEIKCSLSANNPKKCANHFHSAWRLQNGLSQVQSCFISQRQRNVRQAPSGPAVGIQTNKATKASVALILPPQFGFLPWFNKFLDIKNRDQTLA